MSKTLLIDHDVVIFRSAVTNEFTVEWEEGLTTKVIWKRKAEAAMDSYIESLLKVTGCSDYFCCMSSRGGKTYRYDVLPTYKHNRDPNKKPELIPHLEAYTKEHHPFKIKPRLEADDLLGIMATRWPERFVVASIDKDLLQIPGWHYRFNEPELGVFEVTPEEGAYMFWYQILTGDSTDGYPGCPGCGAKKAQTVLADAPVMDNERMWEIVKGVYAAAPQWRIKKQYGQDTPLTEDQILQQARCAKILQTSDWDWKEDRYILWKP